MRDCPALHARSKHYPKRFQDRVPKTIRMLRAVQADCLLRSLMPRWRNVIAEHGMLYQAWTNSHGAVAAVMDDGEMLGLKPDEFEVTDWYAVRRRL